MTEEIAGASLLPYLDPSGGAAHLEIALAEGVAADRNPSFYPFLVVSDSDPLARWVEGRFVTDAGSALKKVFLAVQRDRCLASKNALWPVTNADVDASWQEAFAFHVGDSGGAPLQVLSRQVTSKGTLARFASLFYCASQRIYFHPPCPSCGFPLELCENDELLARSGLPPYAASRDRYLYCPSCGSAGGAFYAPERGPNDPPAVGDVDALIAAFGRLRKGAEDRDAFPCPACARRAECFGPETQAVHRIVPFAFFPFYLLVFDAASIRAPDVPFVVGGASVAELADRLEKGGEPGRKDAVKALRSAGLFRGIPAPGPAAAPAAGDAVPPLPPPAAADEAIHAVLARVLEKWRSAQEAAAPSAAPPAPPRTDFEKTVILSPVERKKEPPVAPRREDLDKTVILSPGEPQREAFSAPLKEPLPAPTQEEEAENVVVETVILMPPAKPAAQTPPAKDLKKAAEEDDLEKTVILKPGKPKGKGP